MVQVTQEYWLEKVKELEVRLAVEKIQQSALQKELDSVQLRAHYSELAVEKARLRELDSELELVRVKQKAHLRESELEMALELAHSKVMAKD